MQLVPTVLALLLGAAAAHDDFLPLQAPQLFVSPCAAQWELMTSTFDASGSSGARRPLALESEPSELHVDLSVAFARFESRYVGFNTRTYNAQIPAPTIKVCPGDRLVVNLVNALDAGAANVTNLHLHGMHVSPEGAEDNVMVQVPPGGARTYDYRIRPDHPAGTFWYHPHAHGLVNTQLQGMMAGALIVADRPGDFPAALAAMDDHMLILQAICVEKCHNTYDILPDAIRSEYAIPMPGMASMKRRRTQEGMDMDGMDMSGMDMEEDEEEDGQDAREEEGFPVDLRVAPDAPLNDTSLPTVYVNGQYQPELHMAPGVFKRLRFLNAIANNVAELVAPDCELHVLAMDGIYRDAPAQKSVVVLPPGGRADLAVKCDEPGVFFIETESSPDRNHLLGRVNQHRMPSQKVLSLRVLDTEELSKHDEDDAEDLATTLPTTLPRRPEYMRSTLDLETPVPDSNKYAYEFSVWTEEGVPGMVYGVNHEPLRLDSANHSMRADELQEWALSVRNYGMECDDNAKADLNFDTEQDVMATHSMAGMNAHGCHTMNHPFHMHSSHFQVVDCDRDVDPDGVLFDVGDWRDTLPLYKNDVTIRFVPGEHTVGKVLTHCHISSHADGGMGQLVEVLPVAREEQ